MCDTLRELPRCRPARSKGSLERPRQTRKLSNPFHPWVGFLRRRSGCRPLWRTSGKMILLVGRAMPPCALAFETNVDDSVLDNGARRSSSTVPCAHTHTVCTKDEPCTKIAWAGTFAPFTHLLEVSVLFIHLSHALHSLSLSLSLSFSLSLSLSLFLSRSLTHTVSLSQSLSAVSRSARSSVSLRLPAK